MCFWNLWMFLEHFKEESLGIDMFFEPTATCLKWLMHFDR
jgi:hypothetical protein